MRQPEQQVQQVQRVQQVQWVQQVLADRPAPLVLKALKATQEILERTTALLVGDPLTY